MDPVTVGILGGSALLGGLLNFFGSKSRNSKEERIANAQNALNYKMFNEQNAFNLDMWNRQNAYNTPMAQVQRLEEAGINPILAMSNISTGTAQGLVSATAQPAQRPNLENELSGLAYGVQSAGQGVANGMLMDEQRNLMRKQAQDISVETAGKMINNKYLDDKAKAEISRQIAETANLSAITAGKHLENKRLEQMTPLEIETAKKSLELLGEQIDWQKVNNDIAKFDLKALKPLQKQQAEATIKATYQSIYSMIIDGSLKKAQIGLVYQQTLKTAMEAQGINISNDILSRGANAQVGLLNEQFNNARKQGKLIDAQTSNTKEHTREYLFRRGFDGVKLGIEAFQRQQQLGINALDAFVPF